MVRWFFLFLAPPVLHAGALNDPDGWAMHVIDDSSRGADGVRLADVNDDGHLDVAVGWEEGGLTRIYLHPGLEDVRERWPQVTVGKTPSVEDAVFADLDGDGRVEVISCCEGGRQTVNVHRWTGDGMLDEGAWRMKAFPETVLPRQAWMFAVPVQLDGEGGQDLVVGSKRRKESPASIGWLQAPESGSALDEWVWRPLREASWVMGIKVRDMDGDGDADILFSERYHDDRSGVYWLEHPGGNGKGEWREHPVGVLGKDALFFDVGDVDGDGLEDVCVGVQDGKTTEGLYWLRRKNAAGTEWEERPVPLPENVAEFKAVSIGDIDLDGLPDLAVDFNQASEQKPAVIWLRQLAEGEGWQPMPLSGPKGGVKTDLCPLVDLDQDGDLDLMTTEERKGLGVIWYENPLK